MIIKLTIQYHGAEFVGWQYQPEQRSVEQVLAESIDVYLAALAKKQSVEFTPKTTLSCSGRTDSGVHAKAQVVSFRWPAELEFSRDDFLKTTNGIAPNDLGIQNAEVVSSSFNARKTPHIKCYKYYFKLAEFYDPLVNDRAWLVPANLDISKMLVASELFRGTHDFINFQSRDSQAKTTIRTLEISELSLVEPEMLVYTVVARGFLKNMVRILAASVIDVGRDRLSLEQVSELLQGVKQVNSLRRAPAHGLSQQWVKYVQE